MATMAPIAGQIDRARDYDLLVFDWDGTLMDSAGEIVSAMQQAIQDIGLPERSPDQMRDLIGLGLNEVLARLFPELDPQRVRGWLSAYRQRYASPTSRAVLFEPVLATLAWLAAEGYELAVATGKSRRGLDRALITTATTSFFCFTRCADEAASKPAPDMREDVLLHTATPSDRALMIGDTEYDMAMAAAAGVDAIGVACGVHDAIRLRAAGALTVLDTVADLPAWLGSEDAAARSA